MSVLDNILNTKEFASLPLVSSSLMKMLEKEDYDTNEVTRLISRDPSLSLRILRTANSPVYAIRQDITSIQQAIMIIGIKKLSNIVLSVSIFSKFWMSSRKEALPLMNKFWNHSTATGVLAKKIVDTMKDRTSENDFLAGLLHQIGTLGLIQFDFNRYNDVIRLVEQENMTLFNAESEIYGINHIDIGNRISDQWMLPNEIRAVITNYQHPDPKQEYAGLVASVGFADILSELNGATFYLGLQETDPMQFDAWSALKSVYTDKIHNGNLIPELNIPEQIQISANLLSIMK